MSELQRVGFAALFFLMVIASLVRSDMAKAFMWALALGVLVGVIINFARML